MKNCNIDLLPTDDSKIGFIKLIDIILMTILKNEDRSETDVNFG
jgi:hypothetical protein